MGSDAPKSTDFGRGFDRWPDARRDPERYAAVNALYYRLRVPNVDADIGFVHPSVVAVLGEIPGFAPCDTTTPRTLTLTDPTAETRTARLSETFARLRTTVAVTNPSFESLTRWRGELKNAHGPGDEVLFHVERAAAPLLGIVVFGSHMIAYRYDDDDAADAAADGQNLPEEGLRIWIHKRAKTVKVWPGRQDNTCAGGISADEDPDDTIVREAWEEASLPEDFVRARFRPAGAVSVMSWTGDVVEPVVDFCYELRIPSGSDVEAHANDGEAEWFRLLSLREIRENIVAEKFRPEATLVLLNFMIQHGLVTEETEGREEFGELVARLTRDLELPVWGKARERLQMTDSMLERVRGRKKE